MQATSGLHRRKSIARVDENRQREPTLREAMGGPLRGRPAFDSSRPSWAEDEALPAPHFVVWGGLLAAAWLVLAGAGVLAGFGLGRFDLRRGLLDHRTRQRFQLRLGEAR